jgi:acetoacetyl-CoA reductase
MSLTKNVLVTGGSRGIGAAISKKLGEKGYFVFVNYNNNKEKADIVVNEIIQSGGKAISIQGNISNLKECENMIQNLKNNFGGVEILINNAGITRDKSFKKMTLEEWKEVIDTNLSSAYNLSSLLIESMIENNFGRIINISSVIGQTGGFGQTNYAAAKAGLIGFSKSLALETAKYGITVNNICPGFIGTEMVAAMPENVLNNIIDKIPMKTLGAPEDIANGVLFLIENNYITGQCLNINGGLYM